MPQLQSGRNNRRDDLDGQASGGLLDPATHPAATAARGYQPVNATNVVHGLHEALLQADTAVRAAANVLTFGWADGAEAGAEALAHGGFNGAGQRYDVALAQQKARNAYDTQHRRVAQLTGDAVGIGLSLYATPVKAAAAVARLPGAVGLTARDTAAILGTGTAAGVAGQTVADLTTGQPSTWQNDMGAGLGGGAQAGALFLGPKRSGAIGGAVTSAAQDFFNGRPISLERAAENAAAGGLLGHVAGNSAEKWSGSLSREAKGDLGQAMGEIRSIANGLRRDWGPKARDPIPGTRKWWFPDGRRGDLRFEDKFGPSANLTKNQKLAQPELGDNFWLNHFLPEDVGKAASVPAAASVPILTDQSSQ